MHIESAGGIFLLITTITALALANSPFAEGYLAFWKKTLSIGFGSWQMSHSLQHWINDGLMTVFFYVIGLEVKRELVVGELRDIRNAALPIAAAMGGMIVPAAVFLSLQWGQLGQHGWGIPMATDIAFVVGIMAILGSRIPGPLRIMLLSLAIVDDIGAILVIALGYTEGVDINGWGLAGFVFLIILLRLRVRHLGVHIFLVGMFVWYFTHESGIHATIIGVVLGLLTPVKPRISEGLLARIVDRTSDFLHGGSMEDPQVRYEVLREAETASRMTISPLERFETVLHPWVGFVIMPIFALANAGVTIEASDFTNPVAVAVALGLLVGKPVGIFLFSWMAVKMKIAKLPEGVNWGAIIGGGFLAGIGFTMALFVAGLALKGDLLDAQGVEGLASR
jgi:NhaA family Na+:H+ antiporter